MAYRIAVDIGGTFTDFCVFDETTKQLTTLKVLSQPTKPGSEISNGLAELSKTFDFSPEDVTWFSHGTTVGVNTVIQRTGAVLSLLVTEGFEDVLELARLKVPDPYNIFSQRPAPLVRRDRVYGIEERTLKDGTILKSIDNQSVKNAVLRAKKDGADTIVVALLHSYANPENEKRVRDIVMSEAPDIEITLSSDVWPVIREYERTVTATVAGYIQRRVENYLTAFQTALKTANVPALPLIGKSNGGVMSAELGKRDPISMLLSGTAAGVIGASNVASGVNRSHVLSFDVGGTSADVAVILDGAPAYSSGEMVGEFPIYVPTVSVTSIGEGGGSIAWIDDFGVLKVGPESAGSNPGPACFCLGGTSPTITDAFAVSGFLVSENLGYGSVSLDIKKAQQAISVISQKLGKGNSEVAESIINIAVSGMFLETSKLLSRRGVDPRHFSLVAFGGAGPMLACHLTRDLGLAEVIVPLTPGVLSAYGGLIANVKNDFIRTVFVNVNADGLSVIIEVAETLEHEALNWLHKEQGFDGETQLSWSADIRYQGQSYEIETALTRASIFSADAGSILSAFHREHHKVYGHSDEMAEVQIVNLRLVVTGLVPKPSIPKIKERKAEAKPEKYTKVFVDGALQNTAVFNRTKLRPGHHFLGPAVVIQDDTTTIVLPGFKGHIDGSQNIILTPCEAKNDN
jgi:N-methylhydantoinase A